MFPVDGRTHVIQQVDFERVNKLLEDLVFDQAIKTQRVFTDLKVHLKSLICLHTNRTCYNGNQLPSCFTDLDGGIRMYGDLSCTGSA